MTIAALVLAAGRAARFGGGKLVATVRDIDGEERSLVAAVVARVRSAKPSTIVVVVGMDADAERVRAAVAADDVTVVACPAEPPRLGASIACGMDALADRHDWRGVLVALGDQPTLEAEMVRAVAARFWATGAAGAAGEDGEHREGGEDWEGGEDPEGGRARRIVVPRYRGVPGHPVLFGREHADALRALEGDVGARAVIERNHAHVVHVDVDDEVPPDVDTPEDLARVRAWLRA